MFIKKQLFSYKHKQELELDQTSYLVKKLNISVLNL